MPRRTNKPPTPPVIDAEPSEVIVPPVNAQPSPPETPVVDTPEIEQAPVAPEAEQQGVVPALSNDLYLVAYPRCYEMVATNYQVATPNGQTLILNQGFTNVVDPALSRIIMEHPTTQLLIDCGMMYTFPMTKTGAANTLGLEVADGEMSDEAPISDLRASMGLKSDAKHRLGDNVEKVKAEVTAIAEEAKVAGVTPSVFVG